MSRGLGRVCARVSLVLARACWGELEPRVHAHVQTGSLVLLSRVALVVFVPCVWPAGVCACRKHCG